MNIIVAGYLTIKAGSRDEFINASLEAVSQARKHPDCEDFSVSADPIDQNRVNIFEKWKSRASLDVFRAEGPDNGSFALIDAFHVAEYEIGTFCHKES